MERVSFIRFHQKCFDFEIKKKAGEDAFVLDCFVLVTYRSVFGLVSCSLFSNLVCFHGF